MSYFLLTISYLLDVILLTILIVLTIGVFQLQKTLKRECGLLEKIKTTGKIIIKKPHDTFGQVAAKDDNGTYNISFHDYKKNKKVVKGAMAGMLGFLALKIAVASLIFLQIPGQGEAATKSQYLSASYQANNFNVFNAGQYTMTQWDNDGVNLQAGQLYGNYISAPIGNGSSTNQWKNLSFSTDKIYGQTPAIKDLIAYWPLNSLEKCTDSKYACASSNIASGDGVYNTKAYDFDGQNSIVKISQNIAPDGSFTIGAWLKSDEFIFNGNEDQNYTIFAKAYGDYTAKIPYHLKYQLFFGFKDGKLSLVYFPDGNEDHWVMAQNNKYNFDANRWYHVAGSYNSKDKTLKLYIDGIEQFNIFEDYDGGKIDYAPNFKESLPSWIGGIGYKWMDGQEKYIKNFAGIIDEVFLTSSTMNISDIKNLVAAAGRVSFQIRTGNSLPLSGPFYGPDGNTADYFYDTEANDLTFLSPTKYLQYAFFIERPNTNFNPKVNDIYVDYATFSQPEIKIASIDSERQQSSSANLAKEKAAEILFAKIFNSQPKTSDDQQFVLLLAYGKSEGRDLLAEQKSLTAYIKHFQKIPNSDAEWKIVSALTYCDKGLALREKWLNQ